VYHILGIQGDGMEKKEGSVNISRRFRDRCFVAKELQFSIALLAVMTLLGGVFLQALASALVRRYGFNAAIAGIFLILGYIALVFILSVFFAHRFLGPFKRLEYEMKLIASGEPGRRLSVRAREDLHVRNFIRYTNGFIDSFAEMSREYNNLNGTVTKRLADLTEELSRKDFDCEKVKSEIRELHRRITEFRQKW
jgi:hypothetical protein